MTLPCTAAEVLSGHVRLEVRCIDRVLVTVRQPRLQYGQGIHDFFCQHRGNRFVSSTLMMPMTGRFAAGIGHYIDMRRLDLVRFAKGQSKDQVAREYLAGKSGGDQILFAGVAKEKARVWRTSRRRDPVTGKRYPWLDQDQAMAGHWYFSGFDADFGPFFIKFCSYFPAPGRSTSTVASTPGSSAGRKGSRSPRRGNAFGAVSDPAAVQRICGELTDQEIYRFAGKWLARAAAAVHPRRPGRRLPLAAAGAPGPGSPPPWPWTGRWPGGSSPGQLIRDNLDIGRPDKVNIVFGRTIKQRGRFRTPGTFRTQVITSGTCPCLYLFYRKTQDGQYLKEGRALRTETTVNQPRGLGTGKELTNLAALATAGYAAAGRRLLDAECISRDPAAGTAASRCSPARSSAPPAPASPGCASPTPASRRSSPPAARSRSAPPASPAATCGTSSPPSPEKTPGTRPAARSATTCAGSAPTRSSNASRTAAPTSSPPTACPPPCSSPG
jgi:hypothetical protein